MTDAEVDNILEVFDKTNRQAQRRIVARLVEDVFDAKQKNASLRAALREVLDRTGFDDWWDRFTTEEQATFDSPEDSYARHVVGDLLDE